jgi:hypothetical protein
VTDALQGRAAPAPEQNATAAAHFTFILLLDHPATRRAWLAMPERPGSAGQGHCQRRNPVRRTRSRSSLPLRAILAPAVFARHCIR